MALIPLVQMMPGPALARRLLECAEPVDPAAHEAIDGALRQRAADRVVHAAALWLAFSAGADLRLSRSGARGWILGLHELIDRGHLDAAAYVLPSLMAAFPQRPYLDSIDFVFRHLPPAVANGRERFVDDPGSDVQIVMTPGADTVVIDFCGAGQGPGLPIYLLDRWLAQLGGHLIYVRDRKNIGYAGGIAALGHDMATTIRGLTRLVGDLGARRIVCMGNSAGGSGALRYASSLGAERVLALVPITGGPEYTEANAPHLPPGGVEWWGDLVPLYREGAGVRAHIVYGEGNAGDRQQCVRMAGLPGVTVEAVSDWDVHHLFVGLLRVRRLERVLGWLVSDQDAV